MSRPKIIAKYNSFSLAMVFLAAVALVVWLGNRMFTTQVVLPKSDSPLVSLPPVRSSAFQNTNPGTHYAGTAACMTCHTDAHTSYTRTAHSRALAEVDLTVEPPGGEFTDPKSMKTYRITHRNGQMIHTESIRKENGEDLVLSEFPVRYTIGSGRFSRSYLVEIDNFLYESPATWYAARPGWALSPGYENVNAGFQRPVEFRCVFCHAGRVEPVDNSPQRVEFHSLVIDCERCHGPGSLHVAYRESSTAVRPETGIDETIVNPAHLSRQLHEDICAQCHLHSAATVELPGRRLQDFRPGLGLSDFVSHYGNKTPSDQMQVVGHAEQMRLSECYQQSETLTCTSCHQPHASPLAVEKTVFYRGKCLECHTDRSCTERTESRHAGSLSDNCITCHMPQSDTEIAHFAFTHHRIGIHEESSRDSTQVMPSQLVPLSDISWQPKSIQERNLGLAYLQFSDSPGQSRFAANYHQAAIALLTNFERNFPGDPEVQAAMSRLLWGSSPSMTLKYGEKASKNVQLSPEAEATACYTIGTTRYEMGQTPQAIPWLTRATELRPTGDVWYLLSECYEQMNDYPKAIDAAQRAVRLSSDRPRFVQQLVKLLRVSGRQEDAQSAEAILEPLRRYRHQAGP